MGKNRLFIPQETMDQWVDEARAVVHDTELTLADDGKVYHLAPAMLFLREATGADDPNDLVGRVKEEAQLTILGADAYMDSVILDDNAYDVRRGFVAVPAIAAVQKKTLPPPAVSSTSSADALPSVELSSPPNIIDDPPADAGEEPTAVTSDDPSASSAEAAGADDDSDDTERPTDAGLSPNVSELEDLSHELEEITEENDKVEAIELAPKKADKKTVKTKKKPATKKPAGEQEEDDVLAKLLLKSLK